MQRFVRAFLSPWPSGIAAVAILSGFVTGWLWIAGLGAAAGAGIAAIRAFSGSERLLERANHSAAGPASRRIADLRRLRTELRRLRRNSGVGGEALQAAEQFDMMQLRFATFRDVLARRFGAGEVTYGRYLDTAEQVYLCTMDDLRQMATLLQAAATVDVDYVNARLRQARRKPPAEPDGPQGIGALEARLRLRDAQLNKARHLLESNERAMTQLVSVTDALANVQTRAGLASVDAETAMGELEALAGRLSRYALDRKQQAGR